MSIASDHGVHFQKATQPALSLELDTTWIAKDGDLLNQAHAIAMEALGLSVDAADAFNRARAFSEGKSVTQVAKSMIHAWNIYR